MSCGALAHAIDDFAAEGFDGAIEFRNVAGDQGAEGAAVAGEFFHQLSALVLHQFVEGTHLQAERVVGVFGLADDLRHQRVHGHVKRIAGLVAAELRIWVARRLPASSILLTRSPLRSSSSSSRESLEFFRES